MGVTLGRGGRQRREKDYAGAGSDEASNSAQAWMRLYL
jgi:hypothetical protein